jgi:hypothetical protein
LSILAGHHFRSTYLLNARQLIQADALAPWRLNQQISQSVQVGAIPVREAHGNRKSALPFDHLRDLHAAGCGVQQFLHFGDVQSVSSQCGAIDLDAKFRNPGDHLSLQIGGAWYGTQQTEDAFGQSFQNH